MRQVELNDGHTVTLYQSISELTAGRYNEFQYRSIQAAGIGGDSASIERHFERLAGFLSQERLSEMADELANLHYCFRFITQRLAPAQLAFGCLVAKVDNEPVEDLTEEGLSALIGRLSGFGLTQGQIEELTADIKKKPNPP